MEVGSWEVVVENLALESYVLSCGEESTILGWFWWPVLICSRLGLEMGDKGLKM
jgi:hypothetical protein